SARAGVPAAISAASRAADSELRTTRTRERTFVNNERRDPSLRSGCPRSLALAWSLLRRADGTPVTQFAVIDADVEAAVGVAARPGLVGDRRAVATVVAEWEQRAGSASPAGGQFRRSVHRPLPTQLTGPFS